MKNSNLQPLLGLMFLISAGLASVTGAEPEQPIAPVAVDLKRDVTYQQDVQPILKKNCVACHNSQVKEGELNLETLAAIRQGGASGEEIIPGDPAASFLYLVARRESEPVMPPLPNKMNAHKLTGEEVWKLRRWIELGATGEDVMTETQISWSQIPAQLQPIYAIEISPQQHFAAIGRGRHLEVISLSNPVNRQLLLDPQLEQASHRDFVNAIAIHPSGKVIASAGYRCIKIWQQPEPQVLFENQFSAPLQFLQTSPAGSSFIGADPSGLVFSWSQQAPWQWNSSKADLTALAISNDGKNIAVASGTQLQWGSKDDPASLQTVTAPSPIRSLLLYDDRIVAGSDDGLLRLWPTTPSSAETPATAQEFAQQAAPILHLQPVKNSPTQFVSCTQSGQLTVWEITSAKALLEWNVGTDVSAFSYAADIKKIATLHQTGVVKIWNDQKKVEREIKSSATSVQQLTIAEEELAIAKSLASDTQNRLKAQETDLAARKTALTNAEQAVPVAAEAHQKTIQPREQAEQELANINQQLAGQADNAELLKKKEAAAKGVEETQKAFQETLQTLERAKKTLELEQASVKRAEQHLQELTAALERAQAHLKQTEATSQQAKQDVNLPSTAVDLHFTHGEELEILYQHGQLTNWSTSYGKPLNSTVVGSLPAIKLVSLNSAVRCLIGPDGNLQVQQLPVGWQLKSVLGPPAGTSSVLGSELIDRVTAVVFSPDGKTLASGGGDPSRDGELILWDWQAGTIAKRFLESHSDVVLCLDYSRDGTKLLTGSADKFVKIFDVSTGKMAGAFEGHTEHVLGVCWSADALSVASASADKTIKIWSTTEGSQLRTISNSAKQVTALQFVSVTDNLVSSCGDKTVRMFQASNGRNYRNLTGGENYLFAVAVTADEELVLSGGQAGILRIWNGKTGQQLHALPAVNPIRP